MVETIAGNSDSNQDGKQASSEVLEPPLEENRKQMPRGIQNWTRTPPAPAPRCPLQIPWVISGEHTWVTLAERRRIDTGEKDQPH